MDEAREDCVLPGTNLGSVYGPPVLLHRLTLCRLFHCRFAIETWGKPLLLYSYSAVLYHTANLGEPCPGARLRVGNPVRIPGLWICCLFLPFLHISPVSISWEN